MRIGNNNQGIWQLFSRMNGGRANTNMPFGSGASARRSGAGGRNTLEDFLSGHRKNSYGVEGMRITANSKRIIKVSDEMKQLVLDDVKKAYYKYNGMSGESGDEWEASARIKNNYYKTLKVSDRSAASWTLQKFSQEISRKVSSAVKEKVPRWTHGQPIPSDVLDEIFADESITSMVSGKSGTAEGLDVKI